MLRKINPDIAIEEAIAHYAGWTREEKQWHKPDNNNYAPETNYMWLDIIKSTDLCFTKDYGWIMKVVDKIEAKGYTFHIEKGNVWITRDGFEHTPNWTIPIGSTHPNKTRAIAETVYQFIDWELKKLDIRRG